MRHNGGRIRDRAVIGLLTDNGESIASTCVPSLVCNARTLSDLPRVVRLMGGTARALLGGGYGGGIVGASVEALQEDRLLRLAAGAVFHGGVHPVRCARGGGCAPRPLVRLRTQSTGPTFRECRKAEVQGLRFVRSFARIPAHDRAVAGAPVHVVATGSRRRACLRVPMYASTGKSGLVRPSPKCT
jgi:hypothetical protein